jgi:hypothetical protein
MNPSTEASESTTGSWTRLRALFEEDNRRGYSGYPGDVVRLLDALEAAGLTRDVFMRRSHESLLLVSSPDYLIWRLRPFIGALPHGNCTFELHFWESVGSAVHVVTAPSLEATIHAIRRYLPFPNR